MLAVKGKYIGNITLIQNVFNYTQNTDSFGGDIQRFDPHALRAYIVLWIYFSQRTQNVPQDFMNLITPKQFYVALNDAEKQLNHEKLLNNYLVDAFEVIVATSQSLDNAQFYEEFHTFFSIALKTEQSNVISVYLQLLHRLNQVFETGTPIEILKTAIKAVHGPITDTKLLNEALSLIESNLEKRHNLDDAKAVNDQLVNFIWKNLCSSAVAKHQCNNCYKISSQLIDSYVNECKSNELFRAEFLAYNLWHFIRAGLETKETVRRKQSIYVLQYILETNEKEVMSIDDYIAEPGVNLSLIWKNSFAILENLLEIRGHLIMSCLDQYLEGIVKHLPTFWYSIVSALVMKHHNNIVVHYGIDFILAHGISLPHDSQLMNGFYQALNNTYLHSEAKVSEQSLAKYFQDSDMNHTLEIMMLISWQPVPLWTMMKSLDIYVEHTKGAGLQPKLLLDFLKRTVRVVKSMPEVDDMTVRILQNIGIDKLSLEQVLGLYDIIPRKEILDGFEQPFDLRLFEANFLQLSQISIETKFTISNMPYPISSSGRNFWMNFMRNMTQEFSIFHTLSICCSKTCARRNH